MILYFSGTLNSAYVAHRIKEGINDEILDLFEKLQKHEYSDMYSQKPWILVCPTYAWRIPHILEEWLRRTKLMGNPTIYFVMTCAGNIGNAGHYLKTLCKEKQLCYQGCQGVRMPENYIALFSTSSREEAINIIDQAEDEIDAIIERLKQKIAFPLPSITKKDKMSSGILNTLFYPVFVHAKKFSAGDACISCGKCERICVENNIHLQKGKPIWGDTCTHCMACINMCPTHAIEYGKHTKGLPRYTCAKAENKRE